MGKRLLYLIVIVVLVVGAYYGYQNYKQRKLMADGDVQCVGCMSPEEESRFKKENAGETADGNSERKTKTARQEVATNFQDSPETAPTSTVAPNSPATVPTAPRTASGVFPPAMSLAAGAPSGDSIPTNAPNGMAFGGKGIYQWYRQGDLTWRVNTQTGVSCIVYATMEEWRKAIVLQHGCGRSA